MMDRRNFVVGGVALFAAAPQLADAQGAGWTLLGSRTVNWASSRDSILVRSIGPMSALSFRTHGGELFITEVELFFSRGGPAPRRMPVSLRVRPNRRSSPVFLRGDGRDIRRIDFRYRRVNARGATRRTTVEVFGRR